MKKTDLLMFTTQYLSLEMYGFSVSCFALLFDAMKYADPPCVVFCHIANRNALLIIMSGVSICHLKLGERT